MPCSLPYAAIKNLSRWIVNLRVKNKTIKLLEENTRDLISDFRGGMTFLNKAQKALFKGGKKRKLHYVKLNILFMKRYQQGSDRAEYKVLKDITYNLGLIPRIHIKYV